ncbi:MAG TPA: Spy/CpxP family protein refolding chaperone [Burkholderiales bacterium]
MIGRINPYLAGLLAAGSLALAIPAAAYAHPSGGQQRHEMRGGARMLHKLDLTEAQREQARKIFQEQAPTMRERMEAARTAQRELRAMAMSPGFDSARARDLADTAARAQADAAVIRAESMSKVFALLTPEQRAKVEEARERRGRR